MTKRRFYKHVAQNLAGTLLLLRKNVAVRVEDVEDIEFWRKMIACARPGVKVQFYPYSCTGKASHATGKKACLKYLKALNSRYLIAVDSDFDYLLDNRVININNHVLQTYTYSWENHHCHIGGLEQEWQKWGNGFSFAVFLQSISQTLYAPLLTLLWQKKQHQKSFTLTRMIALINRQKISGRGLDCNNGAQLTQNIQQAIAAQPLLVTPSSAAFDAFKSQCQQKGLTPDTAYLYMQGHCIYDLVNWMGREIVKGHLAFKEQVLHQSLRCDGYTEINHVVRDIKTLL